MRKEYGAFTTYGVEYVFEYLGESRVHSKIRELETIKTGSMGISLEKVVNGKTENSYFNGKGVLWFFELLLQWFDDLDFANYLYQQSKKYNENNYYDNELLKNKWNEYKLSMDNMISGNLDYLEICEANKVNTYWLEIHFFYNTLSKKILPSDLIDYYINNLELISKRVELDLIDRPGTLLSNKLLYSICELFEQKGDIKKANDIADFANSISNVWRKLPTFGDNDDEENE